MCWTSQWHEMQTSHSYGSVPKKQPQPCELWSCLYVPMYRNNQHILDQSFTCTDKVDKIAFHMATLKTYLKTGCYKSHSACLRLQFPIQILHHLQLCMLLQVADWDLQLSYMNDGKEVNTLKARPKLAGGCSSGIVASVRMATVCITRAAFNGYLSVHRQ